MDTGSVMAGQVAGMLAEIRPVREILETLCRDAETVLQQRQEVWCR
jgi:NAD(P)H-dependent flavin oxidoreductase YrpB (nitropropane dioxygenase family)